MIRILPPLQPLFMSIAMAACAGVQAPENHRPPITMNVGEITTPKIPTPETVQTKIQTGVLDKIKEMAEVCGISVERVQRTARMKNGKVEWDFNSWTVMLSFDPDTDPDPDPDTDNPQPGIQCFVGFLIRHRDICQVSYGPENAALHCKEQ